MFGTDIDQLFAGDIVIVADFNMGFLVGYAHD